VLVLRSITSRWRGWILRDSGTVSRKPATTVSTNMMLSAVRQYERLIIGAYNDLAKWGEPLVKGVAIDGFPAAPHEHGVTRVMDRAAPAFDGHRFPFASA
jgi:hypothetical protein